MAETLKLGNGIWGTKDGSLLAYNDENGNYKPLPFDFTRASSATVVNKAGLIETVQSGIPRIDFLGNTNGALKLEPQRTNLITQSEAFGNSYWTKSGASIGGSVTSAESGTDYASGWDFTDVDWLIGGTATKDNSTTITLPTGGYVRNKFSGVTAKTVLIRLKGSFSGAGSAFSVAEYDTNNFKTITDATFDEYIWVNFDASKEPIAFKYYDGSVTVIFTDIEIYELADGFTSPSADSPLNAFKLVEDTSTGLHRMASTTFAVTSGVDYSLNIYAKYDGRPMQIFTGAAAGNLFANFDLENGVVGLKSASATSEIEGLQNGWYRCVINFSAASTGSMDFSIITVETLTSAYATGYTGDGTSGVYIYGAQLEQSSYPTSYIPTQGSTVTRVADRCNKSDLALTNSTFFVDFVPRSIVTGILDFYNNVNSRVFYMAFSGAKFITLNSVSGGTIGSIGSVQTVGSKIKVAITLNASTSDVTIFINGTKINTYTTNITSLNKIAQVESFGYYEDTLFNQILTYNTILTDAECITLTSL